MYICEVRITNFLSYKSEQTAAELSPRVNVVVGRNGSGKSNFFAAIQFVLSGTEDAASYGELRYSGPGSNFDNGSVDIVFANAAERFVNFGDRVVITREVVGTSSRYLINGKQVTKTRIRSVLDVAGLALGANTLYIIPQGEVTQLAVATDEERLEKLLAVSGVLTFEKQISEADKMLENSDSNMREMTRNLESISLSLSSFKRDVDKLNEYLEVQTKLASAQYFCLKLQIKKSELVSEMGKADLIALDNREGENVYNEISELQSKSTKLRLDILNLEAERDRIRVDCRSESAVLEEKTSTLALAELALAQRSAPPSQGSDKMSSNTMSGLATQEDVETAKARLQIDQEALANLKLELDVLDAQIRSLKLKQGRFEELGNSNSEDQQQQHILDLESSAKKLEEQISKLQASISELESSLKSQDNQIEADRSEYHEICREFDESVEEEKRAKQERLEREKQRNLSYQNARKAELSSAKYFQIAEETSASLQFAKASAVSGVKEVVLLVGKLSLEGYHGTVAEMLDVEPTVLSAVVSIASSRLLYHVVESSSVAEKLLHELKAAKMRVDASFIALDTVIVPPVLQAEEPYATPLIDLITVKPEYQKVAQLLFGRYVLCDTLDHAFEYSRKYQVITTTLEGDLCDPHGPLTGGSAPVDTSSHNRIEQVTKYVDFIKRSVAEKQAAAEFSANGLKIGQQILKSSDELRELETEKLNVGYRKSELEDKLSSLNDERERLESRITDAKVELDNAVNELKVVQTQLDFVSVEGNFSGEFTQKDKDVLHDLELDRKDQFEEFTALKEKCDAEAAKLSSQRREVESRLASEKRADFGLFSFTQFDHSLDDKALKQDVADTKLRVTKLERLMDDKESEISDLTDDLQQVNDDLEALESRTRVTFNSKKKLAKKLHAMQAFRQECEQELKKLTSVPEEAVEKMAGINDFSKQEVNSLLSKYSKEQSELEAELVSFDVVNRKASEQYSNYLNQYKNLVERRDQLLDEKHVIGNGIVSLEEAKQIRVSKLVTDLSSMFPKIYAKISGGKTQAELDISYNKEGECIGIGTKLENGFATSQLSGGQKTIAALALIFAMQACDPAPFYIFDEIDANLDSASRDLVAKAIRDLAKQYDSQYICTTFGSELVEVANKCYGVSYQDHQSSIMEIEKSLAREFVDTRATF